MLEVTAWPRNPWSIFDELESMQESMQRAFGSARDGRPGAAGRYPLLNVWHAADGLIVEAELPGLSTKAVDLTVLGDQLTISGTIPPHAGDEKTTLHRQERPGGAFSRSLKLPFRVDSSRVKAEFRHGILRVTLPRSEEEKPHKIKVLDA